MNEKQLLALGFKNTSFVDDGVHFSEYTYEAESCDTVQVSGTNFVELCHKGTWITVPFCNTIQDLKDLMRLFSLPQ